MDNNKIKKEEFLSTKELLKRGGISFASTAAAVLALYEGILALLGESANIINKTPIWSRVVVWLFISVVVTSLTLIVSSVKMLKQAEDQIATLRSEKEKLLNNNDEKTRTGDQEDRSDSICQLLTNAYTSQRYQEVLKIGMQLSKPLWYAGYYELRAKVGAIMENAAMKNGDQATMAHVLIEMVGWTNVRLGKTNIGKEKIEEGLLIAEKIGDKSLIASAYRNLADIHLGYATANHNLRYSESPGIMVTNPSEEFQACENCLKKAEACLDDISAEETKNDLSGNINYTFSKYYFEKGNYTEALEKVNTAMAKYALTGNVEKQIKLYNLKGEILMRIPDKRIIALNTFREGIQKALQNNVNVHVVSNSLSLAEYFYQRDQIEDSQNALKDAIKYSSAITDPILSKKLENMKKNLGIG